MLNQRFTVGRQYREPWLDSRNAAPKGMVLKSLFVIYTAVQGCLAMYVQETTAKMTWITG